MLTKKQRNKIHEALDKALNEMTFQYNIGGETIKPIKWDSKMTLKFSDSGPCQSLHVQSFFDL